MNINFIRNLSDEILRENQQLKGDLIALRQRLADYEEEMTAAIAQTAPPILTSPRGVLRAFINTYHQTAKAKTEAEQLLREKTAECRSAQLQEEAVKEQARCLEVQVRVQKQRAAAAVEQVARVAGERGEREEALVRANEQVSRELIELKEQLRLERAMLVEAKRREVEQVRQYHLRELLDFREKADREVVAVERQMHAQLADKDAAIKHLEKALEKLTLNLTLDDRDNDTLAKLLRSFQEYNRLSNIVQERSEQLSRFRQQLQEVDLARVKAESRLKEVSSSEVGLLGQMERLRAEKRELEERAAAAAQRLLKSEQDKDNMERYYDSKWNKEIAKVKIQLEKTYTERIAALEADCARRLEDMSVAVQQAEDRLAATVNRNSQLEEERTANEEELTRAVHAAQQLEMLVGELRRERREAAAMAGEEMAQLKLAHLSAAAFLQHQITSLNSLLSVEKDTYEHQQRDHERSLQEQIAAHKAEKERLLAEKERERRAEQNRHEQLVVGLELRLEAKERYIEAARANLAVELEAEFSARVGAAVREEAVRGREREEELARNQGKWMARFKEVDLKYTHLKKRSEDEQELYRKEITRLETDNGVLRASEQKLHAEVKEAMLLKNQFLIRIADLDKRVASLALQLEVAAQERTALEKEVERARAEAEALRGARSSWTEELGEVQKALRGEFEGLRRVHERQSGLLKSKVWELEEMARKRPIKRRDYERLQEMDRERRQLRNEVHIKEAENIILSQVKDYYETKLREEEPPREGPAAALTGYKLKMLRRGGNKGQTTFNELEESKEMTEMRRYIVKSTKRSMKLSLSKLRCEDPARYHRLHTAYD